MLGHIKNGVYDPTRDNVRYGPARRWRFLWGVRFQWPFRSPIVVERIHRFDMDEAEGFSVHSPDCWCRVYC